MFIKTSGVAIYISVPHFVLRLVTIYFFCKKLVLFAHSFRSETKPSSKMFLIFPTCQNPKTGNQPDKCCSFLQWDVTLKYPSMLSTCHSCSSLHFHWHVMSFIRQECLSKMSPHSSWFKQSGPMGIHYTRIGNWLGIVFQYIMVGCVIQAFCN